ncbi:peptide-methionine (S)-S-oxide reductase MsrA [Neolewinella lacunae]|uniref:peptide-methionine (S)-S-oxide reductase n=1 Tax=Neolewinella lacunae TaxID=1517758 RepID=A0A923PLX9_9BACT|nr:peptide-methionine (S)-S-oxide reductase MsrA [Neolewinella lacunae]MBC6995849.1 peptide-methionine (S)-S-oxide reductase MsrA [Neolewinella lacunae]MDN3636458.1 peptide-methionine (S)-S-oxide reductase MsrA [Neolewinella lacunae]
MASGCFWGREYHLRQLPGVVNTRVGFAGGHLPHPTYRQVCTKTTGHAETVEVTYDIRTLSTADLLTEFFALHDATRNRQDRGGQYRSAIFVLAGDSAGPEQLQTAEASVEKLRQKGYAVQTQIAEITAFYPAESRHQQYCSARGIAPERRDAEEIRKILTFK